MREFLAKHMQKLRFAMVGMANVVIDLGLFTLLANAVGIAAGWASIASTSVAVAFSFFGNYYYVWHSKKSKVRTMPQFFAVTLTTAWGVQTGVIWAVKSVVGEGHWENVLAKLCALLVGMVINYLMYRLIFTDAGKK